MKARRISKEVPESSTVSSRGVTFSEQVAVTAQIRRSCDLQVLAGDLQATYFPEFAAPKIDWAPSYAAICELVEVVDAPGIEAEHLACYVADDDHVWVNPYLDHPRVPLVYLAYVVYHELLHAYFARRGHAGHMVHDRSFRLAEAQFNDYAPAVTWERNELAAHLAQMQVR